jgi:hypothetical protein
MLFSARSSTSRSAFLGLLGLGSLSLAFLGGCSTSHTSAATPGEEHPKVGGTFSTVVPRERQANDTARFLAGMPGTEGSPFAALEQTATWQDHHQQLDAAWQRTEAELLSGSRKFQTSELNSPALQSRIVFYPFSGPDSLTATLYFPHNSSYVMVALEPAGTLPTVAQISKKDLSGYLASMRATTSDELGRSFFITRQMDRQFRGQVTDGLLVPILQLLVRTGHTVQGFRYVRLGEAGQVIERTTDYKAPTRYGNKGLEIDFQTDADSSLHKLFYFSVNLSNDRLRENTPFQTYVSHLNGPVSLLKATSYMTHQPGFSMIREALLKNSYAILQDDSGLPYKAYPADQWNVQLYGDYDKPYGSFAWLEQPDLRAAYKTTGPKPLPMHVGYGYRKITSNLLFAIRRD